MLINFVLVEDETYLKGKKVIKIKDLYLGEDGTLYFVPEGKEPIEVVNRNDTQEEFINISKKQNELISKMYKLEN